MKIIDVFQSFIPNNHVISYPYIIAEIGVNHEGDMNLAKRLIDEAKEGGADAAKFQSYKAETIAMKESPAYWDTTQEPTQSQFALFKKYDKFWKSEFEELKKYCEHVGIEFMSTPFDVESATFLNDLMDVYKISSSDLTNKPFIELMCDFQKPIILSTGAATLEEICESVGWIEQKGNLLALLHCVLNYPTENSNAHLGMIAGLRNEFPTYPIGYSDHTLPQEMKTLEVATLLGAIILEKHFTHDKTLPGNDHYHAMDKQDLKHFHQVLQKDFELLGRFDVDALESEQPAIVNARRSLVSVRDIQKGETITVDDLTWKRPASGISPKYFDDVLGRTTVVDIAKDKDLQWSDLENGS